LVGRKVHGCGGDFGCGVEELEVGGAWCSYVATLEVEGGARDEAGWIEQRRMSAETEEYRLKTTVLKTCGYEGKSFE
jgi:hypothetical protein